MEKGKGDPAERENELVAVSKGGVFLDEGVPGCWYMRRCEMWRDRDG